MPRLTKIYTRTGDNGTTGLGDGSRIAKDDARIEAMGDIDELNSCLGWLLCAELPAMLRTTLLDVQHVLFDLGGELSMPGVKRVPESYVQQLEQQLDEMNTQLPALKEFILPGGSEAAARCHLARTVCRRAERRVHTLAGQDDINPVCLQYLNRLSDLLFVAARFINQQAGQPDVLWQPGKLQQGQ
ncbi:MAG: cob(I)yrinic acid a,c-diamide adenosyltransferase [Gammaproteobacteria bacterium]|nr:cob(I)yrinic acid a,c-diamide adenosyltransferase [Gammaproteobacteria bacterium]